VSGSGGWGSTGGTAGPGSIGGIVQTGGAGSYMAVVLFIHCHCPSWLTAYGRPFKRRVGAGGKIATCGAAAPPGTGLDAAKVEAS
jgi:hypothetical protein